MSSPQIIIAEKTLFDVLRDLWSGKFYMLFFSIIMLIFAFLFIFASHKLYRAEMIIAPATHMGQGIISQKSITEGSIAVQTKSLQSNDAFMKFENIYDGVSVANILIKDPKILSELRLDRNFKFSTPRNDWNTVGLAEYIGSRVHLEPVSGTYLRKMVYLHQNKEFASYMIARIHHVSDEIIRRRILKEVNGQIQYLDKALSVTINPEHRRNLTMLLMEQERNKMLVSIDQPYAASIIEQPYVLSKPSWPDPYIIYPVFLFIGLFIGFIIYGLRHHE